MLVELVKIQAGDRGWDDPRCGLALREGLLYVTQTPRVHRDIEDFLSRLPF